MRYSRWRVRDVERDIARRLGCNSPREHRVWRIKWWMLDKAKGCPSFFPAETYPEKERHERG